MTTQGIKPVSFTRFESDFPGFSQDLGGSFARYGFAVISDHPLPQARIEAVAHVHRRLYASGDMSTVAMDEYLDGLMDELSRSLGRDGEAPRLVLDARPMNVTTDQAVSLGVVVTELVTNAVKYAYAPGQGGEIRIRLKADGEQRAILTVEDDGRGMSDTVSAKGTGLGTKLVKAMAISLDSEVSYTGPGVRASLRGTR